MVEPSWNLASFVDPSSAKLFEGSKLGDNILEFAQVDNERERERHRERKVEFEGGSSGIVLCTMWLLLCVFSVSWTPILRIDDDDDY